MCGKPAVPNIRPSASETKSQDEVATLYLPGSSKSLTVRQVTDSAEQIAITPAKAVQNQSRQQSRAADEQNGFDNLHPRRRQHSAE